MAMMFSGNARQTWTVSISLVKLQSAVKVMIILMTHTFYKVPAGWNTQLTWSVVEVIITAIIILGTGTTLTTTTTVTVTAPGILEVG